MCDWNTIWTGVAAIGTILTFLILFVPKFFIWKERIEIKKRIELFFKEVGNKTIEINRENNESCKKIEIIKSIPDSDAKNIYFYKEHKICFVSYDNTPINSITLKWGYYTYAVISDSCIRIDVIDNSNEIINYAFIYKENNVKNINMNFDNFKEITTKWK